MSSDNQEPRYQGLTVEIFRPVNFPDCTLGGVSATAERALLVGEGVEGPSSGPSEGVPVLILVRRYLHGPDQPPYLHAQPVGETRHTMMGGNFIYTCDSRFPSDYPIPIHDRVER